MEVTEEGVAVGETVDLDVATGGNVGGHASGAVGGVWVGGVKREVKGGVRVVRVDEVVAFRVRWSPCCSLRPADRPRATS